MLANLECLAWDYSKHIFQPGCTVISVQWDEGAGGLWGRTWCWKITNMITFFIQVVKNKETKTWPSRGSLWNGKYSIRGGTWECVTYNKQAEVPGGGGASGQPKWGREWVLFLDSGLFLLGGHCLERTACSVFFSPPWRQIIPRSSARGGGGGEGRDEGAEVREHATFSCEATPRLTPASCTIWLSSKKKHGNLVPFGLAHILIAGFVVRSGARLAFQDV